ncbi:type I iodothyronine deiodinase-like [Gigantopelta aegis]|uniref:type I iodothyronine deiodinase-like n=1 Tax=Gigantopelta aegis TaxID=1735272 RepID=UPI001B889AB9|nr:type I iodothyronine deiodinase-like [Gigantopelta aegis]
MENYSDVVDFLVVYLEEAHPPQWWQRPNNYIINIHQNIQERIKAAGILKGLGVDCDMVVDQLDNAANWAYGGQPEKVCMIENGILTYESEKGPFGFTMEEVERRLRKLQEN